MSLSEQIPAHAIHATLSPAWSKLKARIVIADDHKMISEAMMQFLDRRIDGSVSVQETFAAALKDAQSSPCDLLLLDLVMPGMDGPASVAQMVEALPETRVVIFSSCADNLMIFRTLKAGARGFIPKNLALSAFMPALSLILAGEMFFPKTFQDALTFDQGVTSPANSTLTSRDIGLLRMLAVGETNKQIAHTISQTESTVKMLMRQLFHKLGSSNRTQAVNIARTKGWI